jgi:hypothetical protein
MHFGRCCYVTAEAEDQRELLILIRTRERGDMKLQENTGMSVNAEPS